MVGEDGAVACTSCTVRNDDLDVQATETVATVTDLLGRRILAANFSSSATPLPSSSTSQCYVGFTVAGGGDTVSALNAAGVTKDFTYVSTAGGAFLEWMEGKTLPGVAALQKG